MYHWFYTLTLRLKFRFLLTKQLRKIQLFPSYINSSRHQRLIYTLRYERSVRDETMILNMFRRSSVPITSLNKKCLNTSKIHFESSYKKFINKRSIVNLPFLSFFGEITYKLFFVSYNSESKKVNNVWTVSV